MGYKVRDVDLSVVFSDTTLTDAGTHVSSLGITQLTPGATFSMKLGNNPWFNVPDRLSIDLSAEDDEGVHSGGLFLNNPVAQPGATAQIVVFTVGRRAA